MTLLIVKLYQFYKRNGDPNPEMKITGYLAVVLYFATWCIVLPLTEIINKKVMDDHLKPDRAVWVIISFVIFYLYFKMVDRYLFTQKHMQTLEKKYKASQMSTFLLFTLVILLPVLLMLFGPVLAVLLTGGEILGNKITGVFA